LKKEEEIFDADFRGRMRISGKTERGNRQAAKAAKIFLGKRRIRALAKRGG